MNVVITGASSGIGAAVVAALADDGARIVACARRARELQAVAKRSPGVVTTVCDVGDEASVGKLRDVAAEHFDHVDVLINCAGRAGAIGRFEETDSHDWFDTLRTNVFGTYCVTKLLLPLIRRSSGRKIINFAGGGAFGTVERFSAYGSSKAAVVRLSETMAAELAGEGITVNCIAPGFVDTAFHDTTREAGVERAGAMYERTRTMTDRTSVPIDVPVACVRFLVSPAANGLTGKTISANFDRWRDPRFSALIPAINASDVFTQRRINVVNLEDEALKKALSALEAR
jgi:NAD(P)-dependent dehydrogenase (short-subunit alcohol dehydrogenase family)